MRIAISGAGVAGPTLAYWLHRTGHQPTLIERAPRFRTGGYVIDFWGIGYGVAEQMGIADTVRDAGYQVTSVRSVGRDGQFQAEFGVDGFRRATGGKFTSVPRGELAATIYATIEGEIESIFADSITSVDEHADGVRLGFDRAPPPASSTSSSALMDCTPTSETSPSVPRLSSSATSALRSPPASLTAIGHAMNSST